MSGPFPVAHTGGWLGVLRPQGPFGLGPSMLFARPVTANGQRLTVYFLFSQFSFLFLIFQQLP
jgi:hypothetical protein